MSERELLRGLASVPGVRGACLATLEGALLDGVGEPADVLAEGAAAAAEALSAGYEVSDLYGEGPARSVTVAYTSGVVLAIPLANAPEGRLLALHLEDGVAVGRARREAARAAPGLARAAAGG